jgi:RHS repeat-associated protein
MLTFTRTGATGTLTTISDTVGRQIQFTYTGTRVTEISDPLGQRVSYTYDSQGNLAKVIDQEGGSTQYTYDAQGRMLTIIDPRGITYLQNFYGSSGRVLRQVQAGGSEYKFRYQLVGATSSGPGCTALNPPAGGGPISVTLPFVPCPSVDSWENLQAGFTVTGGTITATTVVDPRGNASTIRFNGQGYPIDQTDALGQKVTTQRNAVNQVISRSDALGRMTKFEYDPLGNVKKVFDSNNQLTQFEYHPILNRVIKITDALNQITSFTYDQTNGNLLTITDPLLHTTTLTYNNFGQVISVQGPIINEPPTTFGYDTNGNLITTTDPLGNTSQRAYDAVSRVTSLTDPKGLQTQFRYDGLNRVTEIADARQGITRFTYDPNGNLLTVADAKNQMTTYTYDVMDRLKTRKDALNRQETYNYDLAGNLATFLDRKNQQTTFEYDVLNRRTTATYQDSTTSYTFDTVGRLTRTSDTAPGAGTIDFAYDSLDRLIQETTGQGTVVYQYDVLGRRSSMVSNGQQPITYLYDQASRLMQVAQGTIVVGFGYDNANRRTTLTYPNGTSTSYSYDFASRLTGITHSGQSGIIEALTYQYDAAGNRTSLLRSNGTATMLPVAVAGATYDAANEQTAFAGGTLEYDSNGNLITDGVNTYQWDARNRLVSISGAAMANFNYDALGRRTSKTVSSVNSKFVYDGNDITAEVGGGAIGANYLRSLNIDEPLIRRSAAGDEYYHSDALGSSLSLTDAQGVAVAGYSYEPFGTTSITGASSNLLQYTGRENDGTGLYYYRFRYYSSKLQRFVSEDPLRAGADRNFYNYVSNTPLNMIDPFGLYEEDVHRDLTVCLAKHAGFSDSAAQRLGAADQGVDDRRTTSPFSDEGARRDWHFTTPGRRADLRQQAMGGSVDSLGQYLHALQDSYSHAGYEPDWGHIRDWHGPDKTYNDPDKANQMARDTYDAIRQYIQSITGMPVPDEWDDIADRVNNFNRARSANDKKKYLCQ